MIPIGVILVGLSAFLFWLFGVLPIKQNDFSFITIFVHFLLAVFYGIYIILLKFVKKSSFSLNNLIYCLILFFISCFELNKSLNLFNSSVDWLTIYIIISCLTLLASTFKSTIIENYKGILLFFLAGSSVLFLYYAIYLFPLYLISVPLLLVLGLSIHTFIPISLFIVTYFQIVRCLNYSLKHRKYVVIGFAIPILIVFVYSLTFNAKATQLNKINIDSKNAKLNKLPSWIYLAQHCDWDYFTQKVLKTSLLYDFSTGGFKWFDTPDRNFNEPKKHDPLIVISTFFTKPLNIEDDTKLKILRLSNKTRHQTQEKLWSGDMLEVNNIKTDVVIYPSLRLAYTEKEITIKNISKRSWTSRQEALFTFYLSPGSVATSLSLWVNGVEEKAALTTKSKADSAYRQIVGVEARDPSVLHWQEGNSITVRVFPCTQDEDRRVKIGITSPLELFENQLIYDNVWFDGPPTQNTEERVSVKMMDSVNLLKIDNNFKSTGKNLWIKKGGYFPNWSLAFEATPISDNSFYFKNNRYMIQELKAELENFDPKNVYLDINRTWTKEEYKAVLEIYSDKKLFVFDNRLMEVDRSNRDELFEKLTNLNFTLWPFYMLNGDKNALVITKSADFGPSLDDLKNSKFFDELLSKSSTPSRIHVFNIGREESNYLRSLLEFGAINYCKGSITRLYRLAKDKRFVRQNTNLNEVEIDYANVKITKDRVTGSINTAPDHLKRLFDYNYIMNQVGVNGLKTNYYDHLLVALAEEANVVTPFSSLIVLEKQEDYERFNIKKNLNGLQNASIKSDGAVPEPHEWMLIIIITVVFGVIIWLNKFSNLTFYEHK